MSHAPPFHYKTNTLESKWQFCYLRSIIMHDFIPVLYFYFKYVSRLTYICTGQLFGCGARTVTVTYLYVCWYYGLRLSNLIKETTYLLTHLYAPVTIRIAFNNTIESSWTDFAAVWVSWHWSWRYTAAVLREVLSSSCYRSTLAPVECFIVDMLFSVLILTMQRLFVKTILHYATRQDIARLILFRPVSLVWNGLHSSAIIFGFFGWLVYLG